MRGKTRQGRQRNREALAQIEGGVIGRLLGRLSPQVQGIAGPAALEAVKNLLLEVGREAAAGATGRAVQWAWSALLGAAAASGLEAEQFQGGGHRDGGANRGEVDGLPRSDHGLSLVLLVLSLAHSFRCSRALASLRSRSSKISFSRPSSLSLGVM